MNQRDPKTDRYLGNRNGNKSTGFKKTQNYKREANQMQGTRSRAFMDRETWNALEDSDKKAWDQLTEPAKTKIAAYHFNKGKEYAAQGSEVNQMEAKEHDLIFDDSDEELEAKQHDLIFDDPEEEEEATVEVNNFETVQVSNAESTRKMYEDEGVDFDVILQAQQTNTRIQVRTHELLDSDSSDEESVADLEVNMHNLRPKIQGLMEFSDWDDEDEDALNHPTAMEEVLAIDARGEIDDPDTSEEQSIEQKSTAKMFKDMLQFSDSEDEDEAKETVAVEGKDMSESTSDKGIVGEQEGNLSGLTNGDADRQRLVDEFCSHDGLQHFLDSEDECDSDDKVETVVEEEAKVETNKEETKVMTRSEHEKANIAPPPASKAPHPKGRRARSLSPKSTGHVTTATAGSPQKPKVAIVPFASQVTKPKGGCKVNTAVATDTIYNTTEPGTVTAHHQAPSPKQTSTKTFASVVSTPKAPTLTTPQQTDPKTQTSSKPLQTKTDKKKTPPTQGEQSSKKVPNQPKGNGNSKPKAVTMDQQTVSVNKQIAIRAKQADRSDSPTMKAPFDEVTKPTKTAERIVESPDGKSFKLTSEEEKRKSDTAKKFEEIGLLYFLDDEDDEFSLELETVASDESKSSNESQGSQKSVAKPKPEQPVKPKQPVKPEQPTAPKQPTTLEQPSNLMRRSASKQVKEDELTPFHKDALALAGVLTTPEVTGSGVGGWTVKGPNNRQPNICNLFPPKGIGNMLGIRNPTPPNSDSDSGSTGSNKSNRFAAVQEDEEEEVSDATTDVLPVGEIPETIQEGAVLTQADSNKVPNNIQVEVVKTEVEGGNAPRDDDPQPDGVASSLDADFVKAESE